MLLDVPSFWFSLAFLTLNALYTLGFIMLLGSLLFGLLLFLDVRMEKRIRRQQASFLVQDAEELLRSGNNGEGSADDLS